MAKIKLQGESEKARNIYYVVDTEDKPIGEGGMGRVLKGHCVDAATNVSRPVAIKFLFEGLSEHAVERARREANIRLRNDNLVEMMGFIETEHKVADKTVKNYHVVSELLHGISLFDLLQGNVTDADGNTIAYAEKLYNDYKHDSVKFAKTIVSSVLTGLVALHDAGYVHRDIDPSNIMITDDGHIKLIDFGIAKKVSTLTTGDRIQTTAGVFMGKAEYAAPELVLGDTKHQNQATDIYAMGILLYHCIIGHPPFEGATNVVLQKQLKKPLPLANIKEKGLRKIIECATEKEMPARYQTASQMRVAMENLDGLKREMNKKTKRKIVIYSFVAAILLSIGIGVVMFQSAAKKERMLAAKIEHNDSLRNVIASTMEQGEKMYQVGMKHDENYDQQLISAINTFRLAMKASKNMQPVEGQEAYDAKPIQEKIEASRKALENARKELAEKEAYFRNTDEKEIADNFAVQIANIDKVLNIKD